MAGLGGSTGRLSAGGPMRWPCAAAVPIAALALGAGAAPPPDPLGDPARWVRFDERDGLPPGRLLALVRSGDGTVWAGGEGGLAYYDGYRWTRVHVGGPVRSMASASDGGLYVVAGRRLLFGRDERFEPVDVAPIEPAAVARIAEGGVLVVGPYRDRPPPAFPAGYVVVKDGRPRTPRPLDYLWRGHRPLLSATGSGHPWLSVGPAVLRWSDGRFSLVEPFSRPGVRLVVAVENARGDGLAGIWLPAPLAGLWAWTAGEAPRRQPGEGYGMLAAAALAEDGTAVAVYDSRDVRVRRGGVWRSLSPAPEPLSHARWLRFAGDGELWAATAEALHLFRPDATVWTNDRHGFPDVRRDRVHDLALDGRGGLLAATGGGVERRPVTGGLPVPLPELPDGGRASVTTVGVDGKGRIWAGSGDSFEGVRVLDGERWRVVERDAGGEPLGLVHRIRPGRDGGLWFLSIAPSREALQRMEGRLFRLVGDDVRLWPPSRELHGLRPYDIAVDGEGTVWVASSTGLLRHRDGRWTRLVPDDPSASRMLAVAARPGCGAAALSEAGKVFLAGEDGRLKAIGPASAARSPSPGSLAFDAKGRLWVAVGERVYCRTGGSWLRVDRTTGLDAGPLWPLLPTGERLFVGALGTGLWTLPLAPLDRYPPRIAADPPLMRGGTALVRVHPQPFKGWPRRERIPVRFRVDGGPWSAWRYGEAIEIGGLAPGSHRIEVQAGSPLGVGGPAAEVTATVSRPLYRSPAFLLPFALLTAAFAAVTVSFVRRRRRDAERLRASERKYRRLMEDAFEGILLLDDDLRIASANRSAGRLLGLPPAQLAGRPISSICARRERGEALARAVAELAPGRALVLECELAGHEPTLAEISVTRVPGGPIQLMARDITERRRLERERLQLERRLAETQKLESLGVLAGGVAHDFNNLLTTILGNAEVALSELPEGAPSLPYIENVRRTAKRAAELTRQLLDYAGGSAMVRMPVDLNELVGEMLALLRTTVGDRIELDCRLDPSAPAAAGDSSRLRQVLLNLVVNAGEAIGSRPGRILVTTRNAGAAVELAVEDDGPGVDPAVRGRIFDPFFTTKFSGRGLGLAAVKGIVEAHGGTIEVGDSEELGGALFTVRIPAAARDETDAPAAAPGRGRRAAGGTVLLVDDEPDVREVAARALVAAGYDVLEASSGEEALAQVARASRIDAAVIDLTMPGMDGVELLERLRRDRPALPCVLVSGWSERGAGERASRMTGVVFVRKPFEAEELQNAVATAASG
ncbi:MAG: response regulator [Acidobacteria bacterium]|nr:MAG: response regulator [Acidobacteriota bacterium]